MIQGIRGGMDEPRGIWDRSCMEYGVHHKHMHATDVKTNVSLFVHMMP